MFANKSIKKQRRNVSSVSSLLNSLKKLNVSEPASVGMEIDTESDVMHINVSFESDLKSSICSNDICHVTQLLSDNKECLLPQFSMSLFVAIGKYAKGVLYSILRNNNMLEEYFSKPLYFDGLVEGISKTDNFELMRHLTLTHQLALASEEAMSNYFTSLMEGKAYYSLHVLTTFIGSRNTKENFALFQELLTRSFQTLDNRIISIIVNGVRPLKHKPLAICD